MNWNTFASKHNLNPDMDPIEYGMMISDSALKMMDTRPRESLKRLKLLKELIGVIYE